MDKKIRIMICDDMREHREMIRSVLTKYESQRMNVSLLIYETSEAQELIRIFKQRADLFDIVFLDVNMGNIGGVYAAKQLLLMYRHLIIMLMSVSIDSEDMGYELGVFRFVRKPPDEEKIFRYLDQALIKMHWNKWTIKVVDVKRGAMLLSCEEIIYIKLHDRRLAIFTESYGVLYVKGRIDDWKNKVIDTNLFSPHRSYVLSLAKVRDIRDKYVYMTNGDIIRLSKNKMREFERYYDMYIWNDLDELVMGGRL